MARSMKRRKICWIPKCKSFCPEEVSADLVTLTLEEIEAVRLADLESLSQDAASAQMEISRATFQRILHSAHRNIADALVNGKRIEMKGGRYVVADNPCQKKTVCQNCRFREKTCSSKITKNGEMKNE